MDDAVRYQRLRVMLKLHGKPVGMKTDEENIITIEENIITIKE